MDNSEIPDALTESEKDLINRLRANPLMAAGMEEVMARLEEELANGANAHQAEEAAIEVLQKLGQTMLTQWATRTEAQELDGCREQHPKAHKHAKKNSPGIPPSETSP